MRLKIFLPALLLTAFLTSVRGDDLQTLKSVGPNSSGAAAARDARDRLVRGGSKNLLPVLNAFQGSSPLAANWLRSTFESIADAEIRAGQSLPKDELVAFVKTTTHSPAARRLAYEWLLKRSPELEQQLIPEMLLDPSPDFRRDAVAQLISTAKAAEGDAAVKLYQQAMQGAVHEDQVTVIAKALRDSGNEVNIQKHFGFLSAWKVAGPFDNKDMKGFAIAYPPESNLDLSAEYEGQLGPVTWKELTTDDDYGIVDIAKSIENYKGSLMYAATTYISAADQEVELRLGTPNAWKLWVNGQLVFEREEYHRSSTMDQYKVPVTLKSGPNIILLKICQNEQDQPWAQRYQFQLRVCDRTGSAVSSAVATAQKN
ncbi:MAG: hypothetical protein R3C49_19485 [Planctomycetaceae bacterium]